MVGKPSTEIQLFIGDYKVVFDAQPKSELIKEYPCHGCMVSDLCDCCKFFDECMSLPDFYQCTSITKITHKPATLNYPCGSMGEEIE